MTHRRPAWLPLLLITLFAAACGDDPVDPGEVSITDFVGTWQWNVTNINSSCGPEDPWSTEVEITRVGTSETAVSTRSPWRSDDQEDREVSGTVNGNTLTIGSVTYIENGGDLVATHVVTLQNNGNLVGNETWTWTGGEGTCSNGTATVVALPLRS